ncbi:hypothetical protein H206_05307 [Candidatus Electrothrix aarhusensis]|uniref:Uncharacterized protein n=1 Tax=Candidatus Electrothrix aarhusensis TaxID=1859131 RepID=A0A444J4X3_9BACT|nr:hypothetical protein H206_05307 [Candidatus Electrothrix aarhusensis]
MSNDFASSSLPILILIAISHKLATLINSSLSNSSMNTRALSLKRSLPSINQRKVLVSSNARITCSP